MLLPSRVSAVLCCLVVSASADAAGPWRAEEFQRPPAVHEAPAALQRDGVQAFFFEGPAADGKPTRVFAYLGVPTLGAGERAPGMVLVHGGGGTAFPEWVRQWTARGYAAIALDTGGNVPAANEAKRERHAQAGPVDGGASIALGDRPPSDQWMYHAVANVMLAHSLLAARPEVDAARIGLTGISWGGVVTAAVMGVDPRFRFGVPVYGCGFLDQSEMFGPQLATEAGSRWSALWDPSRYLAQSERPMFWVNGTNDRFFHPRMWQRSARLPNGRRTQLMIPRMGHSHPAGWEPAEIAVFADAVTRGGVALPTVSAFRRQGDGLTAEITAPVPLAGVRLYFTREAGLASKLIWEELDGDWDAERGLVRAKLPDGMRMCFFGVTDVRGMRATSDLLEPQQ